MKVGIAINGLDPESGGGFTFKSSILRAVEQSTSHHRFVVVDFCGDSFHSKTSLPRIPVRRHFDGAGAGDLVRDANQRPFKKFVRLSWLTRGKQDRQLEIIEPSAEDEVRPLFPAAIQENKIELVWFLEQFTEISHVPFFFTVWDLQHRMQPWFPEVSSESNTWSQREKMYNAMVKRASLVVTGTSEGKREIMHFYGVHEANIDVIPLPVPDFTPTEPSSSIESVRQQYELDGDFLLYPAQFWPHKNHSNLLLALDILGKKRGYRPSLALVGSDHGNREHVTKQVEKLGLSQQVRMPGFVPAEDLNSLYLASQCLVFVSYFGPDNIPPLEAFRLNCPVIASDVPGAKEQLGNAAILVNPEDPEAIADAIWLVHKDEKYRKNMTRLGKEKVAKNSAASYVSRIVRHIDRFEMISRNWTT